MTTHPHSPSARRQRGMSLIELMVGITVGLVLVAGLAVLFGNSSQTSAELEKSVRQLENGRYAVDLLAEDISVAGYFGEAQAGGTADTVSPCATSTMVAADLEAKRAMTPALLPFPVTGLSPLAAAALGCLPNHLAGTPALVLRRLETRPVAVAAVTPGVLYLQASNHPDDLNATYIAATSGSSFVLRDMDGTANAVRRYLSRVYYIASCSDCGNDTIPTLKRAELRGDQLVVSPLAEGIENVAFDYGFDTNGDATPDTWIGLNGAPNAVQLAAAAAAGWGNVVAIRLHLVSRATEPSPGFSDTRTYALGLEGTATFSLTALGDAWKRRAYTTTARLNSVAGVRE